MFDQHDESEQSNISEQASSDVTISVFGGMGVSKASAPLKIGGPRQRQLLALLVFRNGSVATTDWISEYLWDDDDRPKATTSAIRTYVSRLRLALPEAAQSWLETAPSGYVLRAPEHALEHERFATLRTAAARARADEDPLTAIRLLDEALDLWRGEPFVELEDAEIAWPVVEQFRLDRLDMLEERWESALALGRHTQISGELAVFAAENPTRDRATRQYALALYRSGRTADALRVISDHRDYLINASGLDPSAEMIDLERAMFDGDSSLDVSKQGRPLRGYRLLDELGSGAFSVVWRGVQPSVAREVAVKQIRSELASQPEFIRRFEAEARLVARLEHPHIVPLIDFWRNPDSAYLVMQLLRGDTLEHRIENGPLSVDETMQLARQVGGALSVAHDHGVIHRDIKPSNIMFDGTGNAFLGDFGIALDPTEDSALDGSFSSGSKAYAPPEQTRGQSLGPTSDIYSFAVTVFEAITGALPTNGGATPDQVIDLRPDIDPAMSDAISTAMSRHPEDRFDTVAGFLEAFGAQEPTRAAKPVLGADANNPYLGLAAFDEAESDHFFGRETHVDALLQRLGGTGLASRCIGLIGPSGSGKSSLVRAGLNPALRSGAIPGSQDWFATSMTPGAEPFRALEAALLRIAVEAPDSLFERISQSPNGLLRVLQEMTSNGGIVYLLIDQFEELFTNAPSDVASKFLDAVTKAIEDPGTSLRVVFTLRADFYSPPLQHPRFAPVLDIVSVAVTPLSPDELERAIVEPAALIGASFEPGLVAGLIADCVSQPAPLPLLQYTLSELFDRRDGSTLTNQAYADIGGIIGAVASRAEDIYTHATEPQQNAIRLAFGRMTEPAEVNTYLRRRCRVEDFASDPNSAWVLEVFGAARLLTFDRDPATRQPTAEVAHEALLREWPRLAEWIDHDRELLRSIKTIAIAADEWDRTGRNDSDLYRGTRLENAVQVQFDAPGRLREVDTQYIAASTHAAEAEENTEALRVRRRRQLLAGVGVACVVALIAGVLALTQTRRAQTEANIAAEQTVTADIATLLSRSSVQAQDDPELAILLALEAHRREPVPATEQAVLNALTSSTRPVRVSSVSVFFEPGGTCGSRRGEPVDFGLRNGLLATRDLLSGEVIEYGPAPESCVLWNGDPTLDRTAAISEDGETLWFGSYQDPDAVEVDVDGFITLQGGVEFGSSGTASATTVRELDDALAIVSYDTATGLPIGEAIVADDAVGVFASETFSNQGSRMWALSLELATDDGIEGQRLVINLETGDVVLQTNQDNALSSFSIEEEAGEIVGVTIDGSLVTLDLDSGEVVTSTNIETPNALSLTIRDDGLVAVASTSQFEVLDRRSGSIEDPRPIGPFVQAQFRDDGLLAAFDGTNVDVLDLEANALVEPGHGVDPTSVVFVDGSRATVTDQVTRRTEIIDLDTGERTELDVRTADGERFPLFAPFFVGDTVWARGALGNDFSIARLDGDEVVEQLGFPTHIGAALFGDRYVVLREEDGVFVMHLIQLVPNDLRVILSLPVPEGTVAIPRPQGGLYVIESDGTLLTYSDKGDLIDELATDASFNQNDLTTALDETSNSLAMISQGRVDVLDLSSGEVTAVPDSSAVESVSFAQAGKILVLGTSDGSIRLWNRELNEFTGLVWEGTFGQPSGLLLNDPASDTIWFPSSGQLLKIPIEPQLWVERACELVGRDLTEDEWEQFVPGSQPLQSACQ